MHRYIGLFFAVIWPVLVFSDSTELIFYRPFLELSTHSPLNIVAEKKGECLQQSRQIKREDAWHCMAEGLQYDPCFSQRFGSQMYVICVTSPWDRQAVKIALTTPLDNHQHESLDMSRTYPWAVELMGGETCQAVVDVGTQSDELPAHYRCEGGGWLLGHVQRCSKPWKMLQKNREGQSLVYLKKAWF